MKTQTSMAAAMVLAGLGQPRQRLRDLAVDVVGRGGVAADLDALLAEDRDARLVLVERYLAMIRREQTHAGGGRRAATGVQGHRRT